ncbi:hypothetical protein HDU89_008640 [Geranomyces variabilis]|nr:hypothetical protein HDU89_008640 [Geranomyces variabilis]
MRGPIALAVLLSAAAVTAQDSCFAWDSDRQFDIDVCYQGLDIDQSRITDQQMANNVLSSRVTCLCKSVLLPANIERAMACTTDRHLEQAQTAACKALDVGAVAKITMVDCTLSKDESSRPVANPQWTRRRFKSELFTNNSWDAVVA